MLILVLFTTLGGMLFGKHADDRFSLYFLESQGRLLESKRGLRDRLAVEMHERQLICCRLTQRMALLQTAVTYTGVAYKTSSTRQTLHCRTTKSTKWSVVWQPSRHHSAKVITMQ